MSGAERSQRKRRQTAATSTGGKTGGNTGGARGARAVAQARSSGPDRKVIAGVVAVVLLAAAVFGGIFLINSQNDSVPMAIPPITTELAPGVAQQREGVVVVSGKPEATTTIDLYADFLCPACGQFEKAYGAQIIEKINAGQLKVRYHMVPMLSELSNPAGYSLDAANASLCAADASKFASYHDSLFAQQPEEGQRGYDKGQLLELGTKLGMVDPTFTNCVNAGTYNNQLTSDFEQVKQIPKFGTPLVLAGGASVDWTDGQWLNKLIESDQQ